MGVPSYFKWVYDNHKDKILSTKCQYDSIDILYLDFNCLIHPACKETPNMKQSEMIKNVVKYYKNIVQLINPKKLVYVAIDGVVPLSKMVQQRKRRFRSAQEKQYTNSLKEKYSMNIEKNDFNMISPGTLFMAKLEKQLHKVKFKNLKVIISGSDECGEGEHKIMHHLKNEYKEGSVAVYGLDADLIFLCLLNCKEKFVLFRESTFFGNKDNDTYFFINIPSMRLLLHNLLCPENTGNSYDEIQKTIVDYTYLCFLHGNDFLPHIPCMLIREGALNLTIEAYKNIRKNCMFTNLIKNKKVNVVMLLSILKELSEKEQEQLKTITDNRNRRIHKNKKRRKPENYEEEIQDYTYIENKHDDKIVFGYPGWEERYKEKISDFDVILACQDYLDGMAWALEYYNGRCVDWGWCYNSSYVPCIGDIYTHLKSCVLIPNNILEEYYVPIAKKPYNVYFQLLYIMPPQSINLIPKQLRYLVRNKKSPLYKYYPKTFKLDYTNKKLVWECDPILPAIDSEFLEKYAVI